MTNFLLRIEAQKLRSQGVSVRKIAELLQTSKSSVSYWVRDVPLTAEQIESLRLSGLKGGEIGRLKVSEIKRQKRLELMRSFKEEGTTSLAGLKEKELLVTGLALYWAEGGKSNRRVEVCNSDPRMVNFLIYWLENFFQINRSDFVCTVGINEIHSSREEIVRKYWSTTIGIPLTQFRKTSFKKVKNKKVYENFDQHYGTLSLLVARSTNLYYRIMGLIEGLNQNLVHDKFGRVAQSVRASES